jgi:hypothetical protein
MYGTAEKVVRDANSQIYYAKISREKGKKLAFSKCQW